MVERMERRKGGRYFWVFGRRISRSVQDRRQGGRPARRLIPSRINSRSVARASVVVREPMGSDLYLTVDVGGNNVKVRTRPDVRFDRGDSVNLFFDPEKLHLFDGESGTSLTLDI